MAIVRTKGTISEAELRALTAAGKTFPEIAQAHNLSLSSLRQAASVLGIKSGRPNNRTDSARVMEFVGLLERGLTLQEVADTVKISRQAVFQALASRGLPTSTRAALRAKFAEV